MLERILFTHWLFSCTGQWPSTIASRYVWKKILKKNCFLPTFLLSISCMFWSFFPIPSSLLLFFFSHGQPLFLFFYFLYLFLFSILPFTGQPFCLFLCSSFFLIFFPPLFFHWLIDLYSSGRRLYRWRHSWSGDSLSLVSGCSFLLQIILFFYNCNQVFLSFLLLEL